MPFKEHPALLAALLSAGLIAARLLAVARFDVSTAATILQVSGTGTVVAGTTLTLLPFALMLVTCLLAVVVFLDPTLFNVSPAWSRLLFCLAAGATLCLTATALVVISAILVLGVAVLGAYSRRRGAQPPRIADVIASSRLLRIQATVLVVLVALAPIILQRPWLPIEALIMSNGTVRVGYVLGDSHGRLAIMSDADRTVRFLEPEKVKARYICNGRPAVGGAARNLPQLGLRGSLLGPLLWGKKTPRYRTCPEPS